MRHWRLLNKAWALPAFVAILIAGHVFVLNRVFSRMTLTVALGLLLLVLLKHLGVFGPIYAFLRPSFSALTPRVRRLSARSFSSTKNTGTRIKT
jgi:hypothetical protein